MHINSNFEDDENLYRAIRLNQLDEDGNVSMAALKGNPGLSVERGNYRLDDKVVLDMKKRFEGKIAKITVGDCRKANAHVVYKPSKLSEYHSEIHDSKDKIELSISKRRKLCKMMEIIIN